MNEEVGPCGRGWRRARPYLCANSVCWPSNLSTLRKTSVFVGGRKRIRTIRFHKLFSTLCQRLQPAFEQIVQALSDTTSLAWFLYFMPFIYYKVYKVRYFVWKEQEKGDVFSLETDKIGINEMYGLEWTKGKEVKNEELGYALLECVAHGSRWRRRRKSLTRLGCLRVKRTRIGRMTRRSVAGF